MPKVWSKPSLADEALAVVLPELRHPDLGNGRDNFSWYSQAVAVVVSHDAICYWGLPLKGTCQEKKVFLKLSSQGRKLFAFSENLITPKIFNKIFPVLFL